ncbi:hypothetical protein EMIT0180MI3_350041 [Priestia megaterium]
MSIEVLMMANELATMPNAVSDIRNAVSIMSITLCFTPFPYIFIIPSGDI